MDAGAQSPKETWLRLLLIQAGLPRPRTQIPVRDEFGDLIAYLDMGWEDMKVAIEYDGDQHRGDRRQYTWDIRRLEHLERLGRMTLRAASGLHWLVELGAPPACGDTLALRSTACATLA